MLIVRFSDTVTRLLMMMAAAWAFILCFFILADIVFRALNMPLQGTKEIVANSVVIIIFMQIGFAVRSGSMLRTDFLIASLSPGLRRTLIVLGYLVGAAFFLLLMKAGIKPAMRSFANGEFDGEGALRVPVWPARYMIVIGSGIAGFNYLLLAAIEAFDLRFKSID